MARRAGLDENDHRNRRPSRANRVPTQHPLPAKTQQYLDMAEMAGLECNATDGLAIFHTVSCPDMDASEGRPETRAEAADYVCEF